MAEPSSPDLFGETDDPAAAASTFADIVFDRPLDHSYSYAVPDALLPDIAIGKRVLVPFGRGDRATEGYCVGLSKEVPEREVKTVLRVLDDDALIDDGLLRLTRWMADYYLCGWGQVLHAIVPAGARELAGTKATLFLEAIPESELGELGDPPPKLPPKQQAILDHLRSAKTPVEAKHLMGLLHCGPGPVQALVVKKLARRLTHRVERTPKDIAPPEEASQEIPLNADQKRAFDEIDLAIQSGSFHALLLHGVTGSGKTEVYLQAMQRVIRQGREVIVLVPEISLTPQTIQRFQGRCGEVAVLHSHLSDAERGGHWRRIAAGQVHVIVGARSAIFAPTKKLGLIVIDEEHENTFKQDTTPRYHARDVAVMRARLENIPIVLGSATPSLESWHNAERGQYKLLSLPRRVLDRPLPQVHLLDLRHEPPRLRGQALSPLLERGMHDALRNGGQVLLLLNRRGYSTYIHCPDCGRVEQCKHCDLTLTFHRERNLLLCHYCGYECSPPEVCAECGKRTLRFQGMGAERLHAEVVEKFHNFVVRRMDSDTMKQSGSHARVLNAFRKGLIHILLGTQMIAKGLDFPNVTLVGVVNADIGLNIPDFRAAERTFQLLAQVAGRTGRGPAGGHVLVQTYNPEHPCVALAARHDFLGFVTTELVHRKAHNYPPFDRLIRLIVRGREQDAAFAFAEKVAGELQRTLTKMPKDSPPVRILGPAEAPVFRLKSYYRFHFQLQSPHSGFLHQLMRTILHGIRAPSGVEFTVDVDPFNML